MAYREIVTKAVVGKGRKYYKNVYDISVSDDVSNVLGCWIINHTFKGREENGHIVIEGKFDCNIWYSYDNDTKTTVKSEEISYREIVFVNQKESTDSKNRDIIVRSLKQPTCSNATMKGKNIKLEIEKELGVEIVGDAKVKIAIEETEEPWDLLTDSSDEEEMNKEIDNIKEDYIDSGDK